VFSVVRYGYTKVYTKANESGGKRREVYFGTLAELGRVIPSNNNGVTMVSGLSQLVNPTKYSTLKGSR
jgi:hypothetical protein